MLLFLQLDARYAKYAWLAINTLCMTKLKLPFYFQKISVTLFIMDLCRLHNFKIIDYVNSAGSVCEAYTLYYIQIGSIPVRVLHNVDCCHCSISVLDSLQTTCQFDV